MPLAAELDLEVKPTIRLTAGPGIGTEMPRAQPTSSYGNVASPGDSEFAQRLPLGKQQSQASIDPLIWVVVGAALFIAALLIWGEDIKKWASAPRQTTMVDFTVPKTQDRIVVEQAIRPAVLRQVAEVQKFDPSATVPPSFAQKCGNLVPYFNREIGTWQCRQAPQANHLKGRVNARLAGAKTLAEFKAVCAEDNGRFYMNERNWPQCDTP
jgi:hypothetical protein